MHCKWIDDGTALVVRNIAASALLINPAGKESAVDHDCLSRNKAGRVGSKKYRSPNEFFEFTEPRHWRAQQELPPAGCTIKQRRI